MTNATTPDDFREGPVDDVFLGRIEVRPPLNDAERGYLEDLAGSSSTLRGTPTGRGDTSLPFARLAWDVCVGGCCLTWNGFEQARYVAATLRFLVDHLLRSGAKADGHPAFEDFTCDHVLDGLVAARGRDGRVYVAEVRGNRVSGQEGQPACAQAGRGQVRSRPRAANVIEFRPRRA